eukprot:5879549-Karenia_brevis.AAC.1
MFVSLRHGSVRCAEGKFLVQHIHSRSGTIECAQNESLLAMVDWTQTLNRHVSARCAGRSFLVQ